MHRDSYQNLGLPHHPLQNLLNLSLSPKRQTNPSLSRHNTFMISDKKLEKTPKGGVKVAINDFYELRPPVQRNLKTSPAEKTSLVNLLNIDSPLKKSNKLESNRGKVRDLHIYSDLKAKCKGILKNMTENDETEEKKVKISPKLKMLRELENEYYALQKKSIENYLKGAKINTQLIEMDFLGFVKLKKARLIEYVSDLDIRREQTPIDKIISKKERPTLFRVPKRVIYKEESVERHQQTIKFLSEIIEKQSKMQELLDSQKDQINHKLDLYNQYYVNYFTPPTKPDPLFTSLKDLSLNRVSLSKDLMNKAPASIPAPTRLTFSKFSSQKNQTRELLKSSRKESENVQIKPGKTAELAGAGVIEKVRQKLEEQEVEYVKVEGQELLRWKKDFDDKRELEHEEREFFKAVKQGDAKKAGFYLIDNKSFVNLRDQVINSYFFL